MLSASEVRRLLQQYSGLPRFGDGRIDYSHSPKAPVVAVFVEHGGDILLLKRTAARGSHLRGRWNNVSGYIDEPKPLAEKVLEELIEEAKINSTHIRSMRFGTPYHARGESGLSMHIHPVLVRLKRKPRIRLNWEHTEFKWIKPGELRGYGVIPTTFESLRRVWK